MIQSSEENFVENLMSKKSLVLASIAIILLIVGGAFWLQKKKTETVPVVAVEQSNKTENTENVIDVSDWKMYENKLMAFSFKYPKEWEVKDGYDAFFGSPINCDAKPQPEGCDIFFVKVADSQDPTRYVVFQTFPEQMNEKVDKETVSQRDGFLRFGKTDSNEEYAKFSDLNEEWGACWVSAGYLNTKLKNNTGIGAMTTYEVHGMVDDSRRQCSKEQKDPLFDKIVESLQVLK